MVSLSVFNGNAFTCLLVSYKCIKVVDTGQFVSGMIKAGVLYGNLVAGLHTRHDLIAHFDVTMAGLCGDNLIKALSAGICQADNVAAHSEANSIAAVGIGGNALGRESCVGGHVVANNGTSQSDRSHTFWGEGVVETFLGIEIIKHVELGIDILHRELGVYRVAAAPRSNGCQVFLINNNVRFDICSLLAHGHNKHASVLGPDGTPVGTAHEVFLRCTAVSVDMHGIVGDEHQSCTCADSRQQFVLYLHHGIVFLSVQIDDGEVEVGLDEIVAGNAVDEFPVAHRQDVVGVAYVSQLQVSGGIDVQEQVAYIVATIRSYIMVDVFRVFCREILVGEDELRTCCLVTTHGEDAGLRQFAFLAYTIVVLLLFSKLEVVNRTACDAFGSHFLELHKVSRLGAEDQICSGRNGDGVGITHRNFSLYSSIESYSTCVAGCDVAFCLASLRGNDIQVVGVAVEHHEHLVAAGIITYCGVYFSTLFGCNLEVEGVVGAIDPISILHAYLGRENGERCVLVIDVELDGTTHGFSVGSNSRQQVGTFRSIKGVLRAVGFAHVHDFVVGQSLQRLDEFTFCIHCHLNLGGKGVARCEQCQRHDT